MLLLQILAEKNALFIKKWQDGTDPLPLGACELQLSSLSKDVQNLSQYKLHHSVGVSWGNEIKFTAYGACTGGETYLLT